MLRAVLDTNIIIRFLLAKPGTIARKLFDAFKAQDFILVLSPSLLDEISQTLKSPSLRRKHHWSDKNIDQFVRDLSAIAQITHGQLTVTLPPLIDRDPQDNAVLATALEGRAHIVVTQDKDLLSMKVYQGVRIIEVPEFYQIIRIMKKDSL